MGWVKAGGVAAVTLATGIWAAAQWLGDDGGAAALGVAAPAPGLTGPAIVGRAQVIDGDTLRIGSVRIRVHGIDAPETNDVCRDLDGRGWDCGVWATQVARDRFEGRRLVCHDLGERTHDRVVAQCLDGTADVAAVMIEAGAARACARFAAGHGHSQGYMALEAAAQAAGVGIFAGTAPPRAGFCAPRAAEGAGEGGQAALRLAGPVERATVFDGHVAALRDPGRGMGLEAAQDVVFAPVAGPSADFGYTEDAIWLRLRVANDTADVDDWRMHFRSNFLPEFTAWKRDAEGHVTLLEDQRPDSGFGTRRVAYPELVVAFGLPPGETATLYLRYASGGSSNLSFAIRTADSFNALAARQTARNFVFYGMMLLLTLAAFLAGLLTRRAIFGAYGCYACVAMLFVMHADGNTFQYLWPDAPAFNAYASVLLGAGLIVFGASFARMFLRTATFHPVLNALLLGLIGVALAMVALTAVGFTQEIKKALVLTAFLSCVLFTVAGLVAARTRFREVRFYVVAWLGAVVASAIMTGRHTGWGWISPRNSSSTPCAWSW